MLRRRRRGEMRAGKRPASQPDETALKFVAIFVFAPAFVLSFFGGLATANSRRCFTLPGDERRRLARRRRQAEGQKTRERERKVIKFHAQNHLFTFGRLASIFLPLSSLLVLCQF